VALAVGDVLTVPETFVWSVLPGTTEARIWMQVSVDEAHLDRLCTALRRVPGMKGVQVRHPASPPNPEPEPPPTALD